MAKEYDLVVRNGTIVDGSGAAPFTGDVAVQDGRIAAVGQIEGAGREEIDASGRIVTPGFVDIHTHYDGHATWTNRLEPSSQHGVTTVVAGNCGVGFAPCKAEDRDRLIKLMEGVEDIPEVVMAAGLPWTWESFPEYLDLLASRQYDVDIATQIPHAPLRVFVMGERAAEREPATPADVAEMRKLVQEAIDAGALGFSTSRSINHKASDGTITPSYAAGSDELAGIAGGLRELGTGVLQIISDFDDLDSEFAILDRMIDEAGRPLSTSVLQMPHAPERYRGILGKIDESRAAGKEVRAQVAARPVGVMMGLEFSRTPFVLSPTYREVFKLDAETRRAKFRDPEVRKTILAEFHGAVDEDPFALASSFEKMYELGDEVDYEPTPDQSFAARAVREGVDAAEIAYRVALEDEGVIYIPAANYTGNSLDAIHLMLEHPASVPGLGDGGAHCGMICDASLPTYMLTRWVGTGEGRMSIEQVVKSLTSRTAETVGLLDRGRIAPGMRADLNVIDFDRIALQKPQGYADLPNGANRMGQPATGYDATIVAGEVTYRKGVATGALPGRLVRGAQAAPA